jgi:hypothetical protein
LSETPQHEPDIVSDFATIFAHVWYRDFPLKSAGKASRADWTMHVGVTVRATADLMLLRTHFESGGRTDAVLRDRHANLVAAIEWENTGLWDRAAINEFHKLQTFCIENPATKFACLLGYRVMGPRDTQGDKIEAAAQAVEEFTQTWRLSVPLLLVVINYEWVSHGSWRRFDRMTFDRVQQSGAKTRLREQAAYPPFSDDPQ